jgi:hypothetical protein
MFYLAPLPRYLEHECFHGRILAPGTHHLRVTPHQGPYDGPDALPTSSIGIKSASKGGEIDLICLFHRNGRMGCRRSIQSEQSPPRDSGNQQR